MPSPLTGLPLLVAALVVAAPVWADDGIAYNLGAVSEYRYRGLSQSRLKPALQGGVDYTRGPFYLGAWASTIKWVKDGGGNAPAELDLYGGYKGEITQAVAYDLGALAYVYPRHEVGKAGLNSPNTFELYGALSYGPATLKYSHTTTPLFGVSGSKGSGYLELAATFDVGGGFSFVPHWGYQRVRGLSEASYTDYALTLNKEIGGVAWSASVVGTDADGYYLSPTGKALDKARLVLGAKVNF